MKIGQISLVVIGSIVVTSLGVAASDTMRGVGESLLGQVIGSASSNICPAGMVKVDTALTFTCADIYEASAAKTCSHIQPASTVETQSNLSNKDCKVESVVGSMPWTFISREEASAMCTRSGKRLPSAEEWYSLAIGTNKNDCIVDSKFRLRSGEGGCTSAAGVHNTIGNVWEWVRDDVTDGTYKQRKLPQSGYVLEVDNAGVATVSTTTETGIDNFFSGYIWASEAGFFGMLRGGYYGSKGDAGIYTVKAETLTSFVGEAVGFRCVK